MKLIILLISICLLLSAMFILASSQTKAQEPSSEHYIKREREWSADILSAVCRRQTNFLFLARGEWRTGCPRSI